jgi:hypothetical protein
MIPLAKMLLAWLIAVVATAIIAGLRPGRRTSLPSRDGILGLGLVVGLPMLVFAFVVGLPLALLVSRYLPPAIAAVSFPLLTAAIAWLISAPLFPQGWKGARQALILFAFILGICWSLVNFVVPPTG